MLSGVADPRETELVPVTIVHRGNASASEHIGSILGAAGVESGGGAVLRVDCTVV